MPRPRLERPNYRLRPRNGVWYVDWTEDDRSRSISTGQRDEAAAERWRDQWVAGREQPPPPAQPLIADIMEGYLADRKGHVNAYARLEYARDVIVRHVGNLAPDHLAKRTFWDRRKREGVANGTIIREGKTLRAALHWAVKERWIDRASYVELPERPPPRDRWLTREEADRLIGACKTPHVRLFAMLAIHTAARKGAIAGLTWDRVDLKRGRIDLIDPEERRTNKRRAVVPINAVLRPELEAAAEVATTEYVLEFRGEPVTDPKKAFERAVIAAGVAPCSPHTLRHSAATWMVEDGVPLAEVARFLGDTEEVVERTYAKHSPDYLSRAANALAGTKRPEPGKSDIAPTDGQPKKNKPPRNGEILRRKSKTRGRETC